jgi:hypothetical protein
MRHVRRATPSAQRPKAAIVWMTGLALGAFLSREAHAQGVDEFGVYGPPPYETRSPQDFALEIRFGPYAPNVDAGVAGEPFGDFFGSKNRYLVGVEFDWQAIRIPHLGTIGPGFGIGYTRFSAFGFTLDGERSGQTSTLALLPTYAVAVARADFLSRDFGIPIVPYGKIGLGLVPWWAKDADEAARDDSGAVGRDISYGYQFALGAMLHLNPFEPAAARNMDASTGVNSAYLFIEFYHSDIDGFGSGNQMQVGTTTWMTGLALEI